MKKRLLYIVNVDWFFISHRIEIARAAINSGYEVHLACEVTDKLDLIEDMGIFVHKTPSMRGFRILSSILLISRITNIIRSVRPDVIHCVTIKPILIGGIVARLFAVRKVVLAISGLGSAFGSTGLIASVRRVFAQYLYNIATSNQNSYIIFQNKDDEEVVKRFTTIEDCRRTLISGSGVNLQKFVATPMPRGIPMIVLVSRLLLDKGLAEFVEAAQIVRASGYTAQFAIAGTPDPSSPSSVSPVVLEKWQAESSVRFLGHVGDVAELYRRSTIVCLPSYYREGVPLSLIEAAAAGRAIVTTNHPGCRDTIIPDKTGKLVPPKDPVALARAFCDLLEDRALVASMGRNARAFAEQKFSLERVVREHLEIYG